MYACVNTIFSGGMVSLYSVNVENSPPKDSGMESAMTIGFGLFS